MTKITLNEVTYEVDHYESDIILMSANHSLLFAGGYDELRELAIRECSYPVRGVEDEMDFDYSDNEVEEWVSEHIINWIFENATSGVMEIN